MKNKIHTSWLIAWASLGVLVGSVLALFTDGFRGAEWLFVAAVLIFIGFREKKFISIGLLLLAGLLIGLFRAGNLIEQQNNIDKFFGQTVIVSGKVVEDPSIDTEGDLRIRLSKTAINGQNISAEIWVSTDSKNDINRSDLIYVEGRLVEGFGNIPGAIYRANVLKVDSLAYPDPGRDGRDWFAERLRYAIEEPEASLGAGFLLGQNSDLPEKLENELRLLGLTHIVVASGYNLTILVRYARRFSARISRFSALALSAGVVFWFVQITGNSPSMARASLIAYLSLIAWYFGRKIHPLVLIPLSASVTVLINPAYAWGDIGWLLSFTAFVGVLILSPLINAYFWGEKKPGNIRQVFIETLSAQIVTLPIIAFIFGQYSSLSLLANVLILPLIPIAMALTFIAGVFAVPLIGWPAEILLKYMTFVVDKLAGLPQASSEVSVNITLVIIYYLFLFSLMVYLQRRTKYQLRQFNIVE